MSGFPIFVDDVLATRKMIIEFGFELQTSPVLSGYYLNYANNELSLVNADQPSVSALVVDFSSGASLHRLKFGGGKGQALARAVGCKAQLPRVLDATAGLGGDAFVLASLGCDVVMLEQSSVVAAMLKNGLDRAQHDVTVVDIINRMVLHHTTAEQYLLALNSDFPDVVYLDPMFPNRKKSAAVKKGMQFFHDILGAADPTQSSNLLDLAMQKTKKRVVVKRPKGAPYLADKKPSAQINGKTTRYDLYLKP